MITTGGGLLHLLTSIPPAALTSTRVSRFQTVAGSSPIRSERQPNGDVLEGRVWFNCGFYCRVKPVDNTFLCSDWSDQIMIRIIRKKHIDCGQAGRHLHFRGGPQWLSDIWFEVERALSFPFSFGKVSVCLCVGVGVLLGRAVEQSAAGPGPGPHHRCTRSLPRHHHLQMSAGQ